ncbi:MAG TPA: glycoside hydrolase family 28 protein [Candidatus Hydrogenedentes bacterium]|nr:glycoside hydrolase family 28 protein [Candidatus Hydrogenedentota bacterium]HPG68310.1 glycoside hydrolase family 28 protein [Candidatus Hydrogenedentota bacterium]
MKMPDCRHARSTPTSYVGAALLLTLAAGLSANADTPPTAAYNVRTYGTKGDGETLDTKAIQNAVDACHTNGGGTVHVPAGTYLTGTVFLRSHVQLYLDAGAVLLGSTNLDDYPEVEQGFCSYTNNYTVSALIYTENAEDVGIVGPGSICGQGAAFSGEYKRRPYLIRFVTCQGVRLRDVTLRDGAMWTVHFLASDDVCVDGITLRSRVNHNNDGLDIDCCRNVRVSNCDIWCGDDAIVLKSTGYRATQNVAISNCVLSTLCNALKMGTESNGGFQQVTISNCVIYETRLAGVALEVVDGGTMDGITVSNLTMKDVGCPLFIRLGNRARPPKKDMERPGIGALRNVTISSIEASGANGTGCSITGLSGHPVENVTLSNLRFTFKGGEQAVEHWYDVPEKEADYPEYRMFGTLPAYGVFCRHVSNLRMDGVDLRCEEADSRPALLCHDVDGLEVQRLHAMASPDHAAVVGLRDVRDAIVQACKPSAKAPAFVRIDGPRTADINLLWNDLDEATAAFTAGDDVPAQAVRVVAPGSPAR